MFQTYTTNINLQPPNYSNQNKQTHSNYENRLATQLQLSMATHQKKHTDHVAQGPYHKLNMHKATTEIGGTSPFMVGPHLHVI